MVHQVATVAVVHNALNRQLVRGEPQEEEESEDGDTGPHVAADAMSDVSDTAVLVAVNAIAEVTLNSHQWIVNGFINVCVSGCR